MIYFLLNNNSLLIIIHRHTVDLGKTFLVGVKKKTKNMLVYSQIFIKIFISSLERYATHRDHSVNISQKCQVFHYGTQHNSLQ